MARKRKRIESEAKEDKSKLIISDDVIEDILIRLPARTLGGLRCVSKHWFCFLTDPQFLNRHAVRTQTKATTKNYNGDENKLACYLPNTKSIHAVDPERGFDKIYSYAATNRIAQRGKPSPRCSIIGSDNGLICLNQTNKATQESYLLCNPVTRECSKAFYNTRDRLNEHLPLLEYHQYGFGYDLSNNDYKLARVVSYADSNYPYRVDVLSWKNNCWTSINDKDKETPMYLCISPHQIAACVGGVLHWRCGRAPKKNCSPLFDWSTDIFTFDLGTNKCGMFSGIPKEEHEQSIISVSMLQGCLCIIQRTRRELLLEPKCFDIWMMKEYEVEESWIKLACIPGDSLHFYFRPRLISYANKGSLLMFENDHGQVFLYKIEDGSIKPCKVPNKFIHKKIVAYTESLVSPP